MIGVLDSGLGGVYTASLFRSMAMRADLLVLADRRNLPYGKKSRDELYGIVKRNLERLRLEGADSILVACCTASSIYRELFPKDEGIVTAIGPAARRASDITRGRIAVIATDTTARSHAFSRAIAELSRAEVTEHPASELVTLIESGARDGALSQMQKRKIKDIIKPALASDPDTLLLGCTHFPLVEGFIRRIAPDINLVSSSREAAFAARRAFGDSGAGRTIYTE